MTRQGERTASLYPELDFRILTACREMSISLGGPDLEALAVTSAGPREGRTTFALGMALVQARDYRRRVILLDLSQGRDGSSLAERLGVSRGPGLAEVVSDGFPLSLVRQTVWDGLTLVTAGRFAESLIGPTISAIRGGLLRELREQADVLIADLPPLLGQPLARLIATEFQRLVVVVAAGQTPASKLQEAVSNLPIEPAFVLNGTHSNLPRWLQVLTGG